jgi:hypothetical protein
VMGFGAGLGTAPVLNAGGALRVRFGHISILAVRWVTQRMKFRMGRWCTLTCAMMFSTWNVAALRVITALRRARP